MMEQEKTLILLSHYFFHVVYDGAREKNNFYKTHSHIRLFFVCCLWWSKRKIAFCYNIIFCMFSMMEQEQKNDFCQTHFLVTLFFVSCLWWRKIRKLNLLLHYFFYVVDNRAREKTHSVITIFLCVSYDAAREKSCSVITLFFVSSLWWSRRKNSLCYNTILCVLSIMEQEKKLILL